MAMPGSSKEQQQSLDSEKQVTCSEALSGPENAPTLVEPNLPRQSLPEPAREEGKEVTNSWQTQSQGQSGLIPMVYHESNSPDSPRDDRFFNDVKGPPPAYDTLGEGQSSNSSSAFSPLSTPTSLEPDTSNDVLPPRPEDKSTIGQLLAWIPPQSRRLSQPARLAQPVIIPQLDVPPHGESVPFQRCYSDALAAYDVSMQDFTRFLDGLEVAQLPGSALQGLKMFGVGVTHVPIPILGTLTGKGISKLASSGSGHSGSRARLYLEQAKERFFEPRGIRVSIVKDDDLNPRLQVPSHAPRLGTLTQNTLSATSCQRRLEALAPYTAPLRFDVPDQDKQIQGVQKMARKHLHARLKEKSARVDALRRRQWEHTTPFDAGAWEEKYRGKMAEVRRAQEGLIGEAARSASEEGVSAYGTWEQDLKLKQRELEQLIGERQNLSRDPERVAAEMEEVRWAGRLKWLVIESL